MRSTRRRLRSRAGTPDRRRSTRTGRCRAPRSRRSSSPQRAMPAGWEARLDLVFERDAARTVLAARKHVGPLRVQKALYPEGPGGVPGDHRASAGRDRRRRFAGDRDRRQSAARMRSSRHPGAAKWYRSVGVARAVGHDVARRCRAHSLEWLPQETMLFDGARASISLRVELAPQVAIHRLGRDLSRAHGVGRALRVRGSLRQSLDLFRDGALLFCERAAIDGGSRRAPIRCNPQGRARFWNPGRRGRDRSRTSCLRRAAPSAAIPATAR